MSRTIRFLATPALLLALFCPAQAQDGSARDGREIPDSAELLRRAGERFRNGDYRTAASVLKDLCRREPDSAAARSLLGHSYYNLGRFDDARRVLAEAVSLGRLTTDVLGRLADLDRRNDHSVALITGLRLRTLVNPEDPAWTLLYADILASTGSESEAERIYLEIAAAEPARFGVQTRLGNLYLRSGREEEALTALETAFHLGDPNPALPGKIAGLCSNVGDHRRALFWLEQVIRRKDDPEESLLLRRARLLYQAGELDGAEEAAHDLGASEDREVSRGSLFLLGRIALQREDRQAAADWWERAIPAGLEDGQVLAFLGSRSFNEGDYAAAARYLERSLSGEVRDGSTLRYLIVSLIRSGDRDRALERLTTYVEIHGLDEEAERMIRLVGSDRENDEK